MKNYWLQERTETAVYATANKGLFTLAEEPKRTDIVRIHHGIVDCIFSAPEIYIPSKIHNTIFSEGHADFCLEVSFMLRHI